MAGGETKTPVKQRTRFTEDEQKMVDSKTELIKAEIIHRMGGGVREQDKWYAYAEARKQAHAWARENNIGTWPS